jgi:hypothetical protein
MYTPPFRRLDLFIELFGTKKGFIDTNSPIILGRIIINRLAVIVFWVKRPSGDYYYIKVPLIC